MSSTACRALRSMTGAFIWGCKPKPPTSCGASQAKIEHSQGGGAFYRVGTDTIHLPTRQRFSEAADYYATALHEVGHWTGHPNRLNRDLRQSVWERRLCAGRTASGDCQYDHGLGAS
jgi:Zincin-like metallopeptidase